MTPGNRSNRKLASEDRMSSSKKFLTNVPRRTVDSGIQQQILGYDPTILMARADFEEGSIGANHSHVHAQVTYVESGKFEVNIDGERQVLGAGDAFYVPPNADHGAQCLEAGTLIDVFSPIRSDFFDESSS